MRRKLAFAMAFTMLLTSVPVNALTGYAEEAVIVEELSAQDEEAVAIADLPDMEDSSGTIVLPAGAENDVLPDEILEPESSEDMTLEEHTESDAVPEGDAAEQTAAFAIEAIDVMETEPKLQNLSEDIAVHDDDNYDTGLLTDMDDEQYYYEDAGELLTLYASASINVGHTLTYEWYDEDNELVASESKIAESDITDFKSLYTFECEKNTVYFCCISDEEGNQIGISYVIIVDTFVWESDRTDEYNLYFNDNDVVVLQASEVHSTYGTLTYQWYEADNDDPISGEVTDTLELEVFRDLSEMYYQCRITDGNSVVWIDYYLYSANTLRLEYMSEDCFDVSLGKSITMSARAAAAVPTEFRWYFRNNSQGSQKIEVSGAVTSGNSSTLTVIPTATGTYYCEAVLGESTDEIWFYVDIDSGLHIGDDSESSVYCKIGDTVTLTAKAYSENQYPLTYQWYYSSETYFGDSDSELIEGAVSPSLPLENVTKDKFGCYTCYVNDGYNTNYYIILLEQSNTLQVTAQNLVQKVDYDNTIILEVNAQSTVSDAQLGYQWYSIDEEDVCEKILGATTSVYSTPEITYDCRYQCRVSDGCSEQWITFYLTLSNVNTENTALTFADAKELTLDQPATAVIPYADTAMYFKFTPTKSGRYKIYSADNSYKDPFGALYDNSYNFLMDNDDGEASTNLNFELLYDMLAGQTYYIKTNYKYSTGSYPVTVSEFTEADSHTCHWDNGVVVEEQTCTQGKTIRYTCTICKKTREDYSNPLGHSYGSFHEAMNATCTQEGISYRECSRCGKIQTIKRPKTVHTYGEVQTDTSSSAVTKTYKTCQNCGAEQILSVMVDKAEQQKILQAEKAIEDLNSSGSMANAVTAVKAMDNQALIDVEENNDTGNNTAIAMVNELETNLLSAGKTDITGTIISSTVADANNEGNPLDNAKVSGAAVTVASVLMEAKGNSSTQQPNSNNSYYAEVLVEDKTTSETPSGTYSIDISMNIMEKTGNDSPIVFRSDVQPAAPILITIPVPSKFWNSEFELLHKGQKVKYTRDYNNQTISFYAASLSPWELNITKCNVHKYETDQTQSIEATCCALGKAVSVCKVCQTVKTQLINKKAHTLSDWIVSAPATCTTDGQKYRYCSSCNTTIETQTIPANGGHNWVTVTDAAPTCGTNGSQHEECSICHTTQNPTAIPANGGHNWVTVTDVAPTCGTNGSQHEECSVCHTTQNTTAIPATGAHNYVNYVVTQAPTALQEGAETGSCSVCGAPHTRSVAKLKATLKLTSNQVPLQLNKSVNLKSLVTGLSAGDSIKSWKSNNTAIATVSKSGKVTGKKVGTAKITVTLASGATAVIKVNVQKKAVTTTKVSVASKKVTLNVGKSTTLKPIITPVSSLQTPTYSSSNKKVAVVNSKGKVTAKAAGKTTITIKSGKKSVKVTVIVPAPEVKNIKNVPTKKTLKKGKSFTLKPTLTPKGASAKFSYSTSNKKVATVSKNGKITAKKKGTAVITVTAGKITKSCTITVK